jgi:mono/diheme cytochrome c family protein
MKKRTIVYLGVSFVAIIVATGFSAGEQSARAGGVPPGSDQFAQKVVPFVNQSCAACHNDRLKTGGLTLTNYHDTASMLHDRDVWEAVVKRVRSGEMPPKGLPRPKPETIEAVTKWIESQFEMADRTTPADPGRLTAHRLNRTEYNNAVRDLLGIKFKPGDDFPADDSGYGFDNIGDVLSVSPVLLEKYLNAATKIANIAIPPAGLPRPTQMKFAPEHEIHDEQLVLEHTFDLPADADYDLRAAVGGKKEAFRIHIYLDGQEVRTSDVLIEKEKHRVYETRLRVAYGEHALKALLVPRTPNPEEIETARVLEAKEEAQFRKAVAKHPEDRKELIKQRVLSNPPTYIDFVEVRGPFHPLPPPLPPSYRRIFVCGHAPGQHTDRCVRSNLANFARLAYRRPVAPAEVDKVAALVISAKESGLSLDQAMRIGVETILVSPNFLFRIERDAHPQNPLAVHAIDQYELASRLSYFLWSSMPDEHLMRLADQHRLNDDAVLEGEVARMLKDPKSNALVDNFAGQWLELRNLDSVHPDPDEFADFNNQLRQAMYTETEMFVNAIVRENRSILDFINGNYTFVNERLAKFYGIPGVTGDEFQRVTLDGRERSGVLTQASVLAVTSYPTRTSPVLRGKWILENVLNTPPPPPPPGVGSIDAQGGPLSGTMRQQMEKHRAEPACAGCHARMDPVGFALENYNAVGKWRERDANLPIDASGVLPNGKSFSGSAELKAILASNKDAFAECLTEKLLTYALGRGLEGYDRRAVKQITANLAANDYKFGNLIEGIVNSAPFRMGRGDGGSTQ